MDPLRLPPMCLDLSEMIREDEIGGGREKEREREAPVSVREMVGVPLA